MKLNSLKWKSFKMFHLKLVKYVKKQVLMIKKIMMTKTRKILRRSSILRETWKLLRKLINKHKINKDNKILKYKLT